MGLEKVRGEVVDDDGKGEHDCSFPLSPFLDLHQRRRRSVVQDGMDDGLALMDGLHRILFVGIRLGLLYEGEEGEEGIEEEDVSR